MGILHHIPPSLPDCTYLDDFLYGKKGIISIRRLKNRFELLQGQVPKAPYLEQLHTLSNMYIFRDLLMQCDKDSTCDTSEVSTHGALEALKSSGYRQQQTGQMPVAILKILHANETHCSNAELCANLELPAMVELQALAMANHAPFAGLNLLIGHFHELPALYTRDELSALLSATLLEMHGCERQPSAAAVKLLKQAVISSFISMDIASQQRGHTSQQDSNPLRSFITTYLHWLSLFYIYCELENQPVLPSSKQLLAEIDVMSLRLGYWLAKDWGLPEDILYHLKMRFQAKESLSQMADICQRSEHAGLTLMLYQNGHLSLTKTEHFLRLLAVNPQRHLTARKTSH